MYKLVKLVAVRLYIHQRLNSYRGEIERNTRRRTNSSALIEIHGDSNHLTV